MLSLRSKDSNSQDVCRRRAAGGFTIIEVLMAALVLLISYIVLTQALVIMNGRAAASRLGTNARVIVERNIAQALSVPFSPTTSPAILAMTSAAGATYDDDGGGDGRVKLTVQDAAGTAHITAVLTRIVTAVANPESADIRRVTFRVAYTYRRKNYTFEATTVRAMT